MADETATGERVRAEVKVSEAKPHGETNHLTYK